VIGLAERATAALTAALTIAACSSSPAEAPLELCAPDARVLPVAEAAAARWEGATGPWIDVDGICDPWETPIVLREFDECRDEDPICGLTGIGADGREFISVDTRALEQPEQFEALLVHETGHWLGQRGDHLVQGEGTMRAKGDDPGLLITDADIEFVCADARVSCSRMVAEEPRK
jgi:hypothetical protein